MLSEVKISKLADIKALDKELIKCDGCLRLKLWREEVAVTKRRAYQDETYWGKPVPGFGPVDAQIVLVGLAPGAHGANRTGRIFTGDASGDWLFPELFSAGLANQPTSKGVDDGLQLINTRVLCAVRCVPPDNKAETSERDTCSVWFNREIELLMPTAKVFVALGAFAWDSLWRTLREQSDQLPTKKVAFAHGAEVIFGDRLLLASFHPSQQNTATGKLKVGAMAEIFQRAGRFTRSGK
ncbi:MAG: uracil-DNA glycosylase [Candidatus Nanopelagicaceae bacterium]|nr:uracil-DNA glycosylase [Candidatus Nanopelagicaceae bacterium]